VFIGMPHSAPRVGTHIHCIDNAAFNMTAENTESPTLSEQD
jgi:hypothetical protein